ncbi:MAG: response regulator [Desulfobulbaceae bacterium]|nr:response regulator [Desulfobulbaceae bacterium]
MKSLIVEDDFVSGQIVYDILISISRCDLATTGSEAICAFDHAWEKNDPYNLICLDIMLPDFNGYQVLDKIRNQESEKGIYGLYGAKVIMITSLHESRHIIHAFNSQCEGYLIKPVLKSKLIRTLIELELLNSSKKTEKEDRKENDAAFDYYF